MDATLIEALSEKVHDAWMTEKLKQGFADHPLAPFVDGYEEPFCARCSLGKFKHHTDMLPYADLPEHIKEYDRVTVRAVLGAIDEAGYRLWPQT